MKETLKAINQMQADGVIGHYAIGGAVAATFYLEPAATYDIDIFVILPAADTGLQVSLAPIYEYLKARGAAVEHEHIVIDGWPVQFLLPSNNLEREAVASSLPTEVDKIRTWIRTKEHLVAIALQTGRTKDYLRILQFVERRAVDMATLQAIIERHGLTAKWKKFQRRFLGGTDG